LIRAAIAWGPAVLWAAVLFFLSSLPDPSGAGLLDTVPAGDKLAHFILYAVLGALLARGRGAPGRIPHLSLVAAGALYGASDEWHQSFVPGREVSVVDWSADVAGVAAGYWLALSLLRRRVARSAAQVPAVQAPAGQSPAVPSH
jgi:VanZ family protein